MARGSIRTRQLARGKEKRYDTILRAGGKQVWRTFKRKKDAEEWLDRNSTEVHDGTYRKLNKATFREYAKHWRSTHLIPASFKPSTYNSYCSLFEHHLLPEFAPYQMTAISSAEINKFKAGLLSRHLSNQSVRNILHLLSRFFNDALSDNFIKYSPMQGVKKPRVSKEKKGRALALEEINCLLEALDADTYLMVLTALLTGVRESELFGLFWEDFDWDHDVVRVRRQLFWRFGRYQERKEGSPGYIFVKPKSHYAFREIDISPILKKELLMRYLGGPKRGLVFRTSKGTPFVPNNIYKRKFRPALQMAGIKGNVRFHDLRHTFGALKIEQGENPYYIQRQMGHSSIQVTFDVYGHLLKSRKPEAAARTDALVFGIAETL